MSVDITMGCQNQNTDEISGFQLMFEMTNFFLGNVVQTKTIDQMQLHVNFSNPYAVEESFSRNWQLWFNYAEGFLVCAIIGVCMAIIMPVTGICFCICRCFGKCGAKVHPKNGKRSDCCRGVVAAILLVLNILVFVGVVCALILNSFVFKELQPKSGICSISNSFKNVSRFYNKTETEITGSITSLDNALDAQLSELDNLGVTVQQGVIVNTSAAQSLNKLMNYTNEIETFQSILLTMNETKYELVNLGLELSNQLATIGMNITNHLNQFCPQVTECENLLNNIKKLQTLADFSNASDVTDAISSLQMANSANMSGMIAEGRVNLTDIKMIVDKTVNHSLNDMRSHFHDIKTNIENTGYNITSIINSLNISNVPSYITDAGHYVQKFAEWLKLGMILVLIPPLFIVTLIFLGLLWGVCCKRRDIVRRKCDCDTHFGSYFLMFAVSCIFIFYSAIILVTCAAFVVGGLAQTELCRHLLNPENSPAMPVFSDVFDGLTGLPIDLKYAIGTCKNNGAIYTALDVDKWNKRVNVTETIHFMDIPVRQTFNKLRNCSPDLSHVVIFNSVTNKTLHGLSKGINSVDISTFDKQLRHNITRGDLSIFVNNLTVIASTLSLNGSKRVTCDTKSLNSTLHGSVHEIASKRDEMNKTIMNYNAFIGRYSIDSMIRNLQFSQRDVEENGGMLARVFINETVNGTENNYNNITDSFDMDIRYGKGKCRELYDVYAEQVNVICSQTINSFNAIWFSLGVCLFVFLFLIVVALILVSLYRKSEPYRRLEPFQVNVPNRRRSLRITASSERFTRKKKAKIVREMAKRNRSGDESGGVDSPLYTQTDSTSVDSGLYQYSETDQAHSSVSETRRSVEPW